MQKRTATTPTKDRQSRPSHNGILTLGLITALFLYATPYRLDAVQLGGHLQSKNSAYDTTTAGAML